MESQSPPPQYEVIAAYPDNKDFPVGKIIEFHPWNDMYWQHSVEDCQGRRSWLSDYFDNYPHLFRKILFFLLVASVSYGQVFSVRGPGAGIFRVATPVATTANYTQTGTIIVSDNGATYQGNANVPARVFDGDASTYYDGPDDGAGKYIGRDLGAPRTVNTVRVLGRQGTNGFGERTRINSAQIQYSANGSDWTTVYTVSGVDDSNYTQYKVWSGMAITARYWRLYWPNGGSYTNAAEMEIKNL